MNDQDWKPVVWHKKASKNRGRHTTGGEGVTTVKKVNSGRQRVHVLNARKLDDEETDFRHKRVSNDLKRALQHARQAKKLTQKQLAGLVNEKVSVINSYENGSAIPNQQVKSKLQRVLGTKLPK